MTIKELKEAVIELGFETSLESDNAFFYAANRAIIKVNDIQPKMAVFSITQNNFSNLINNSARQFNIVQKGIYPLIYSAMSPKAYYFEADGNGSADIERYQDGIWQIIETIPLISNKKFKAYKGLIPYQEESECRLRFSGDFSYNVRNVAMYGEIYSNNAADIPDFTPYVRYDIRELTKEGGKTAFLALDKVIIQEGNYTEDIEYTQNKDYFVENDSVVLLNYFDKGQFNIWYSTYPDKISGEDDEDTTIDLAEDLACLLPELVASYVWLDGENLEKAQRYYDIFLLNAGELRKRKKEVNVPYSFKNISGW